MKTKLHVTCIIQNVIAWDCSYNDISERFIINKNKYQELQVL